MTDVVYCLRPRGTQTAFVIQLFFSLNVRHTTCTAALHVINGHWHYQVLAIFSDLCLALLLPTYVQVIQLCFASSDINPDVLSLLRKAVECVVATGGPGIRAKCLECLLQGTHGVLRHMPPVAITV
jgi:hypothetical protein